MVLNPKTYCLVFCTIFSLLFILFLWVKCFPSSFPFKNNLLLENTCYSKEKNGFPRISQCACCRLYEGANAYTIAKPNNKVRQPMINVKAEPHGYAHGCSWNLHHPTIYFHSPIACLLTFDQYVNFLTW